jgi:dephospho-CoA kinase
MGKPVIGLTGGIGSGKTSVGRILEELGGALIESDRLGHEALAKPAVIRTLKQWWGDEVLDADGATDRVRLAAKVFADRKQRKRLEELLHPLIAAQRAELMRRFQVDPAVRLIVIDAPLLYEAGIDGECDTVIFVEADPDLRAERVRAQRGWSAQELTRRENLQMPLDMKRRKADHIVTNNSSLAALRGQVMHLITRVLGIETDKRK